MAKMGASNSVLDEQALEDYQELTYFTKKEILHVHKRFREVIPNQQGPTFDISLKVPMDRILQLDELKENPFGDRMCKVFSTDGTGNMTFEDFLDMMSVFSDHAPKNVKVEYAFRIYDFDDDDMLSNSDLEQVINRLTGGDENESQKLSADDMKTLIENIYSEADLDDDDTLSFAEFEHVISKAPDFVTSFRIRL
ncbi:calcium and integrin-binding protein 1-like [Watersipora subatra]|uniref:calcium and integrin-binding protein 1-like n=1 Tax=Watersipora subatra TaxID=2589382 RepID=UPI00355B5D50